jgi:UDP-glucose 4-epimerase
VADVLITGGAGYIGSTVAHALEDRGHRPVILDDFSTGARTNVTGYRVFEGDIADAAVLAEIAAEFPRLRIVVHCAARIVVPESVAAPLAYYDANVAKAIEMLRHLATHDIRRIVFSSSASVYPAVDGGQADEGDALAPGSPYARTKAMIETVLADAAAAGEVAAIALRYFNPIGVDPLLRSGPRDPDPTHVLGRIIAAHRAGVPFTVTGTDWPTRDGSGLRDFVHVWDLARAHALAVERFDRITGGAPFRAVNLGGGEGTTVRELVAEFERVVGVPVAWQAGPRRPGDSAGAFAGVARAQELLGWRAEKDLADGIRDSLAWAEYRGASLDAAPGRGQSEATGR